MKNNLKVIACVISAAVFASAPLAAYVLLLAAMVKLVSFDNLFLTWLAVVPIVVAWILLLLPFAAKMAAQQLLVGFAEAAKLVNLSVPSADSDKATTSDDKTSQKVI
jgi:hypothetical protein